MTGTICKSERRVKDARAYLRRPVRLRTPNDRLIDYVRLGVNDQSTRYWPVTDKEMVCNESRRTILQPRDADSYRLLFAGVLVRIDYYFGIEFGHSAERRVRILG